MILDILIPFLIVGGPFVTGLLVGYLLGEEAARKEAARKEATRERERGHT